MFEAIELGQKVSREDFAAAEAELRTPLLEAQRALRARNIPVAVIVSGVEGAGKSEVTNRLTKWLDTRGLVVQTFWKEDDAERERPTHWRFWRKLPSRGQIAVFFGSWYTKPIVQRVFQKTEVADFQAEMRRINDLEAMLSADGALIIKLWFHIPKSEQARRLKKKAKKNGGGPKPTPWEKRFSKQYSNFIRVSEAAIRATDSGVCPWHLIEATDRRHRDLTAGRALLEAFTRRLAQAARPPAPGPSSKGNGPELTILDKVDLTQKLDDQAYRKKLEKLQDRLSTVAWQAWQKGVASVAVFEGWDAAGKGGAIRRLVTPIDARLFQVVPIGAPTDEERGFHHLWRFWKHVPPDGYVRIFDRSWYGRVLVERVEGFARPDEWRRSYREITHFEEQLAKHGIVITKFWLHLSQDEQLRRFEERKITAWKTHKITDEDWRNREKWEQYRAAVSDMVAHTSTRYAPWVLVPGDDKRFARVEVIKSFTKRLEAAVGVRKKGSK